MARQRVDGTRGQLRTHVVLMSSAAIAAEDGKLASSVSAQAAGKVHYAEAFEVCEYGRRPDMAELAQLFPFLPKAAVRK